MTRPSEIKLEILADPEALALRVADWQLAAATAKDGVFAVALSGSSTPRRLYEHRAGPPYRDGFSSPYAMVLAGSAVRASR
jgi:6-phosphogluconolactonase